MPELPEVETLRRQLTQVLVGRTIERVELRDNKIWSGVSSTDICPFLIKSIERKGKVLAICSDDAALLIHLKMTGQLLFQAKNGERIVGGHPTEDWVGDLPSQHTRVIFFLNHDDRLFFNDQRIFGWVKAVSLEGMWQLFAQLPPDAIDEDWSVGLLSTLCRRTQRSIKVLLMDSSKIGGVGNIYASEALFVAGIDPHRSAASLNPSEIEALHAAVREVLLQAIELGGTTISDFRHLDGLGGRYQTVRRVYQRVGEPCLNCQTPILITRQAGRSTFYCPQCQK